MSQNPKPKSNQDIYHGFDGKPVALVFEWSASNARPPSSFQAGNHLYIVIITTIIIPIIITIITTIIIINLIYPWRKGWSAFGVKSFPWTLPPVDISFFDHHRHYKDEVEKIIWYDDMVEHNSTYEMSWDSWESQLETGNEVRGSQTMKIRVHLKLHQLPPALPKSNLSRQISCVDQHQTQTYTFHWVEVYWTGSYLEHLADKDGFYCSKLEYMGGVHTWWDCPLLVWGWPSNFLIMILMTLMLMAILMILIWLQWFWWCLKWCWWWLRWC